jgi:pimeloyl-ACP methyl ester carboxylesterase
VAAPAIEPADGSFTFRVFRAGRAKAALLVMPGGNCRPERYDWLGVLAASGVTVLIADARPSKGPPPPIVPMVSNPQFLAAIAIARRHAPKVYAAGHSAGASLILDALDPPSNTRAVYPPGYEPPRGLSGVAVMGCSLQTHTLNIVMAYRSDTRLLARPDDIPLLFLSGDHDAIAPPALMEATLARYAPPTTQVVLTGATHYGYAEGHDASDNPMFDAPGGDIATQRQRAAAYIGAWIMDKPLVMQDGDLVRANTLGRIGPAIVEERT